MVPESISDTWLERLNSYELDAFLCLIAQFNTNMEGLKGYEDVIDSLVKGQGPPTEHYALEMIVTRDQLDAIRDDERIELLEFGE